MDFQVKSKTNFHTVAGSHDEKKILVLVSSPGDESFLCAFA
jgi:hypothetical protein